MPAPEPIILNVGITGHRASVLTAPLLETLKPVVDDVFQQLREAALKIQDAEAAFCSSTPADLRLHTGLASGADQIAASSARSSGYFVRAVLPFEADEYRNDFAPGDELDEFERALGDADEVVALPGSRSDSDGAYVLVGQSLIEAADVLVAIWDGEEGRGPGGTAHVVELALQSSVPVIHIDIDRGIQRGPDACAGRRRCDDADPCRARGLGLPIVGCFAALSGSAPPATTPSAS